MSLLPLEVLNAGMIDNIVGFKFGTRGHSEGAGSFLGMVCAEINPETGVSHSYFDVEDKHLLFTNQLHGGCTAAFLDTAMPLVVYPFVPTGSWVATMNLNINYLKSVEGGRVDAYSTIHSLGKTSSFVTARVENEGRVVALGSSSMMIKRFDPKNLKGETWR